MSSTIWTEKYRPQDFDDIKGHKEIVKRVRAFVEQKNMPHLLFSGPAGVGKTTMSLVIAKTLFGESWQQNMLELNASDERGIDIVRNKVKDFARTKAMGDVPWKIIYLDECDALTKEAQQALRRTMENFTKATRFILSCNYSSKIIDPIQSRCAIFRFKSLSDHEMLELVKSIKEKEGLIIDYPAEMALVSIASGDCRRLENIMQSCASLGKNITEEVIYSIASQARPKEINDIMSLALKNKFVEARDMLLKVMLDYGLSGIDIIKQMQAESWKLDVDNRRKIQIVDRCGETEFRLVEGSDEFVQLESLLAFMALLGQN